MSDAFFNQQSLSVHNKTADSRRLSEFLAEYTKSVEISTEVQADLRLVIEEIFINIVSYAFIDIETDTDTDTDKKSHPITVEFSCSPDAVNITFIDSGIAFNPLNCQTDTDPSIENSDHCEGGMGIHLIKSLTDQQEYKRIEQRNVFTVTKHYTKKHSSKVAN